MILFKTIHTGYGIYRQLYPFMEIKESSKQYYSLLFQIIWLGQYSKRWQSASHKKAVTKSRLPEFTAQLMEDRERLNTLSSVFLLLHIFLSFKTQDDYVQLL